MSHSIRFPPPVSRRFFHSQYLPLIVLVLLSLAGYTLMSIRFPLVPFYRQFPLADIRDFTPSLTAGATYGLLVLVLYGLYWLAFRFTQQRRLILRPGIIMGTAVLFGLPLLQTYPLNATDVFRYLIQGRITTYYHTSPYIAPPNAFPQDPFLPMAGEWADQTSPYGPVWEIGAAAVTSVTGGNLHAGLLVFKLVGLAAFVACGWLIWLLLANAPPTRRLGLTLLWAWNPALLFIFVVDAHNDGLMLLWLLLGYWVLRRGYPVAGMAVMFYAVLTKLIALLPFILFFLATWHCLPGKAAKRRFVSLTAVTVSGLTFLAFLPFGSPFLLIARLAQESAGYPGFSLVTAVLLLIDDRSKLTLEQYHLVINLGRAAFVALAGWLVWRTWHGRNPLRAAADIFFAYLLTAPTFRIWYAAWPFPWLLLNEAEKNGSVRRVRPSLISYPLRVGLWFLLTTQLSVIIYGHLHFYVFDEASLPTHLIGVPFTFGLPFLLALWPHPRLNPGESIRLSRLQNPGH